MTPLISIIIPTFNRADLIGETLDSVLAQTYANWECIIVDDGSTDNSIEVIQKYLISDTRFNYFSRPEYKKKGPSSCRNFGLEKSNGQYIIFLDSDDLLADFCLDKRIEFALANQNYDLWIFKMTAFETVDKSVKFVCGATNAKNESLWSKEMLMNGFHPFMITGPLWTKQVLLCLHGFNENLTLLEDLELHLRFLKKGYLLKFANYLNSDCFCRKDSTRKENYAEITLKNHFLFFKMHLEKDKKETILYFQKVFNSIIFNKSSFIFYFRFCKLGVKIKVLSFGNIFFGLIVIIYHSIGLHKRQGFGYNYFKTQFNKF